jgi:hypothetical protein
VTVVSFINTKRSVKCDLVVEQGVDIDIPITVFDETGTEINYASYTGLMRIRPYPDADEILLELSSANNKITTGDGKITLHFTHNDLSGVTWMNGEYDLKMTSALDKRSRVMEGHFQIDPEVTR